MQRRRLLQAAAVGLGAIAGCQSPKSGTDATETNRDAGKNGQDTETATGTGRSSTSLSVSWSRGPDAFVRRTQATAVALGGKLYVVGGIVEDGPRHTGVYDPDRERWEKAAPPPEPINHTSGVAYDGRLHVFGGYTGSFLGGDPLDGHWIYDPGTDEWTEGPSLPTGRGALVAAVTGERIYAVGGATEDGTTDRVEAYDPSAREWERVGSLPEAREHLAGGTIDGRVYAAGGRQGLGPMTGATACYDPKRGWQARSEMPTPRAGIAGSVLEGRLFVFGGEEVGEQVFEEVEAYDPRRDEWTAVAPMPTPRWGLGVATLEGRIYTVGGGAVPSAEETRTLEVLAIDR